MTEWDSWDKAVLGIFVAGVISAIIIAVLVVVMTIGVIP